MRHSVVLLAACRISLILALLGFALAAGCGPASSGKFKLLSLDGELVVVPPPYWKHAPGKSVSVTVPVPPPSLAADAAGCSFQNGLFRVAAPRAGSPLWRLTLPSLHQWLAAERADTFRKDFGEFLDGLETLEARNCIPSGSGRLLAEGVRESVPVKNGEALLYRYDFGQGQGFIDLERQMKLQIQRAVYGPDAKFAGTQAAAYEFFRDSAGRLELRSAAPPAVPGHVEARDPSTPDLTLAERIQGFPYYRLFYLGDFVPREHQYEAMLVGTRTRGRMEEVTNALRRREVSACPPDSPADPVDCHLFAGLVTVTAEIGVTVNGKPVFGTPRFTVGDALSRLHLADCLRNPRAVRVERQFLTGYAPVVSGLGNVAVLKMQVYAGDRITCSPRP